MRTASFRQTPLTERVYFGLPAAEVIAEEMEARRLERAMIVASTTLAGTTPVVGQLIERLEGRVVEVRTGFSQHSPNDEILRLADRMRAAEPDVMITIGGGSVVDCAKVARLAVGASAKDREGLRSLRSIMGEDGVRRSPPYSVASTPMIAVATTLSAAEYTDMAGSTDPQIGMKDIYKHPRLAPEVVVLDPAVAVHTPQRIWIGAGARAVDHAVETVCSHLGDHYSNGPALHAIRPDSAACKLHGWPQIMRLPASAWAPAMASAMSWVLAIASPMAIPRRSCCRPSSPTTFPPIARNRQWSRKP